MKGLLCVILTLVSFILKPQAIIFPALSGVNLNGGSVHVPVSNGKYSVLAIAFSRKAEDDLRRWLNPLYETFVKVEKSAGGMSSSEINNVNFYFIPLISGFKKLADDFKKGTDKEYWQYIIDTEKTDIKAIEKKLSIKDDDVPYFFVLDKEGKIIETQSGNFQSPKLDKLEDAVE
jgi:hypothetical protein